MHQSGNFKKAAQLFGEFFLMGCYTFGGGFSIIAQMQKIYVVKKKTLTEEELLDITTVGRSLPGAMICNVACLYGYHMAGILGALACIFGMMLPPMVILSVITFFYTKFRDNVYVARAMVGVRAAVVPIIANALVTLWKSAFKFKACYVAALAALLLYCFLRVNCIILVLMGLVFGIVACEYKSRKEDGCDPAS